MQALEIEQGFVANGNEFVPRTGSPADSLRELANAGDELADRRGTCTTTDFTILNHQELVAAAQDHGLDGQFELAYVFDADDTASIEIICDTCRGLGHVKRLCPSNRNGFRSYEHAIGALQSKLTAIAKKPMRRPPGRGQRPPFRPPFPRSNRLRVRAFRRLGRNRRAASLLKTMTTTLTTMMMTTTFLLASWAKAAASMLMPLARLLRLDGQ